MNLNSEIKAWADEVWEKLDKKLSLAAPKVRNMIPYTVEQGTYVAGNHNEDIHWWTNGFWGGLMWIMYTGTGNEEYKKAAEHNEMLLDGAFENIDGLHHDVGFMWKITAGTNYMLTKNEASRRRIWKAANLLLARYNVDGGYIRAWNGDNSERFRQIAIIDCMMNIPLLYWATEESGDGRYKSVAMRHADKTMNLHVRPDGSVNHIMRYDENNGEVVSVEGGQGMDSNSSWSRGQAWGLYGFTLSYMHTGKKEYLDTAKKIANYFIAAVCADWLPRSDFRAPKNPVLYDSTASAIAACGLLELSKQVGEHEQDMYFDAAIKLLKAAEEKFADWSDDNDGILDFGSERYHNGKHMKIIYGDFYFAEAIAKLRGTDPKLW